MHENVGKGIIGIQNIESLYMDDQSHLNRRICGFELFTCEENKSHPRLRQDTSDPLQKTSPVSSDMIGEAKGVR